MNAITSAVNDYRSNASVMNIRLVVRCESLQSINKIFPEIYQLFISKWVFLLQKQKQKTKNSLRDCLRIQNTSLLRSHSPRPTLFFTLYLNSILRPPHNYDHFSQNQVAVLSITEVLLRRKPVLLGMFTYGTTREYRVVVLFVCFEGIKILKTYHRNK